MASRFAKRLEHVGKAVVLRKREGDAWTDMMAVSEIQQVTPLRASRYHELISAGILEVGDAVGYFPAWTPLEVDDRVILDGEYMVSSLDPKRILDETVYIRALLKRAHDTVAADFYGPNQIFFDDFESGAGNWTVKSGSWSIQTGQYVGEDPAIALSVAGEETWKDYVLEALVTVESGDAGLACRFSSPDNVDQYYMAALRVAERVYALEAMQGGMWARLKETPYNISLNQQYRIRVHCFGGFLILFLDGAYMFTVSDLGFKKGKIGATVFEGKAAFDSITVWGET